MGGPTDNATDGGTQEERSVDLALRAKNGDRQALDQLFRRHAPGLKQWAAGRLPRWARDMVDTEDIVQETMLRTLNNLDTFRPQRDGALQAYMRQALRNRIADEVRKVQRKPTAVDVTESIRDDEASPLEETIGRQTLERYEEALARLPESDREAVVARVELCLPYEQIARNLGKSSPDAARMTVSRALVRLAREMKHEP